MKIQNEVNQTIITSTGCPNLAACDLAEAVLDGTVTGKEIIAKLMHISDLIVEERKNGGPELVPAHVQYLKAPSEAMN